MYFAKKSEYNDIREKSFLQWLDEMRKEYNRRFENNLTLEFIIEGAIINEIWRLSREMLMSEERTFSIGIEGGL